MLPKVAAEREAGESSCFCQGFFSKMWKHDRM